MKISLRLACCIASKMQSEVVPASSSLEREGFKVKEWLTLCMFHQRSMDIWNVVIIYINWF